MKTNIEMLEQQETKEAKHLYFIFNLMGGSILLLLAVPIVVLFLLPKDVSVYLTPIIVLGVIFVIACIIFWAWGSKYRKLIDIAKRNDV